MLTTRLAGIALLLLAVGACSSDGSVTAPSSTTTTTTTFVPALPPLRVGLVATTQGPNAERDDHAIEVLTASAELFAAEREIVLEIVRVDAADDVGAVVDQLIDASVTVVFTTCDGSLTQEIVAQTSTRGLLTVTSCASLPPPQFAPGTQNLIDLGSLADHATVLADHLAASNTEAPVFVRSTLVGDVSRSCLDAQRRLAAASGVQAVASISFDEVNESLANELDSARDALVAADAIVVCALPGGLADAIGAIRQRGHDQAVYLPWFGESERWSADDGDVRAVVAASVFGDDPQPDVNDLVSQLDDGVVDGSDLVTADAIGSVIRAATAAESVGSDAIEREMLRSVMAATGELIVDPDRRHPVDRTYRVVALTDGSGELVAATSPNR